MSTDTLCAVAFPPLVLLDYVVYLGFTPQGNVKPNGFGNFGPEPYNFIVNVLLLVATTTLRPFVQDGETSRIYKGVPVARLPLAVPLVPCLAGDRPSLFAVVIRDVLVAIGVAPNNFVAEY